MRNAIFCWSNTEEMSAKCFDRSFALRKRRIIKVLQIIFVAIVCDTHEGVI